jgi:hypothetical protein
LTPTALWQVIRQRTLRQGHLNSTDTALFEGLFTHLWPILEANERLLAAMESTRHKGPRIGVFASVVIESVCCCCFNPG